MVGSINKLLDHLNRDWEARCQVLESQQYKDQEQSFIKTLAFLRKHALEKDLPALLNDEKIMIHHSLQYDANSPEESQSLKTALSQIDDATLCLNLAINNPEAYRGTTQTYPSKKKEAGLPLDAFRDFIKSHSARLTNRLAGKGSHSEKLILRQRKDNLSVIRGCYIELQQETLGIAPPSKSKDLSR